MRTIALALAVAVPLALCAAGVSYAMQITNGGNRVATIVVPDRATGTEGFAAEELQSYSRQISGAKLPIEAALVLQPHFPPVVILSGVKRSEESSPQACSACSTARFFVALLLRMTSAVVVLGAPPGRRASRGRRDCPRVPGTDTSLSVPETLGEDATPSSGSESQSRVASAYVFLSRYYCDAGPVVTDKQGGFHIDGLPRGRAQLYCKTPGLYKSAPFDLVPVPSEAVQVPLEGTGGIQGRVMGAPAGERVHIHMESLDRKPSWGGAQLCKEDSSFAFEGVPPGRYWLSTVPRELLVGTKALTAQIVEVTPEATVEVEVRPGATVEVEVPFATPGELR